MEEPEPDRRRNIKAFVSHQRIDLVYEETLRIFSIWIKYSDEKAEAQIVSEVFGFPRIDVTPDANNTARRASMRVRAVPKDTVFLYNEKFFTVTESDGRVVHATCDDDGEQIHINNEFLWNLILES